MSIVTVANVNFSRYSRQHSSFSYDSVCDTFLRQYTPDTPALENAAVDLYFIRHADSPTLADAGVASDFDRPLSDVGRAQCQALAAALNKVGVRLEAIVTS